MKRYENENLRIDVIRLLPEGASVRYGYLGEDFGHLLHTSVNKESLAENDGLSFDDWNAWFRDYDRTKPMAVIHFTNFRYCK